MSTAAIRPSWADDDGRGGVAPRDRQAQRTAGLVFSPSPALSPVAERAPDARQGAYEDRPTRPELLSRGWRRVVPIVKARDGRRCRVCGVPESFHTTPRGRRMPNLVVGHMTPPERYPGSHNDPANLWTLCTACNASQGNRTVEEWYAARSGRLVDLGLVGPSAPAAPAAPSSVVRGDYT